jgi:hypothetical protein
VTHPETSSGRQAVLELKEALDQYMNYLHNEADELDKQTYSEDYMDSLYGLTSALQVQLV